MARLACHSVPFVPLMDWVTGAHASFSLFPPSINSFKFHWKRRTPHKSPPAFAISLFQSPPPATATQSSLLLLRSSMCNKPLSPPYDIFEGSFSITLYTLYFVQKSFFQCVASRMQPWTKNLDDALQLRGNFLLLHARVGMRPADALARGGSNERVSRGIMGNRGVCVRVFFACANEWGQLVPAPALCVDTDRNEMEKVLLPIFFLHIS